MDVIEKTESISKAAVRGFCLSCLVAVVVVAGVGDAAGCGDAALNALQACSVDGVVRVCCRSGELAVDITGLV